MNRTERSRRARGLFAGALLLFSTDAGAAKPDSIKPQCVQAYEQTQSLRKQASFRAARESAVTCAQDACPAVVKKDCTTWLEELDRSLPTVVLSARDRAGQETAAVRVFLDNTPLAERLDGMAVAVDPGEHTFRFEIDGGAPTETRTLIREGEKNRRIEVSFVAKAPAAPEGGLRSTPAGVFVLGGIGVLGLGSFVTFAALGTSEKGDLEKTCAPRCTDEAVGRVRTKLLIGDISLVSGLVALGAATTLFFLNRPAPAPAPPAAALRFDLRPLPGGGAGMVGGSF